MMGRGGDPAFTAEPFMRVGFGYDVHPLVPGRKLIIGGVEIPFEKGLQGHSDADVLLHALCDSLLGAMADGDIGRHFPNTDPRFRGISSLELLKEVGALVKERGLTIGNLDATVVAERPMIGPHIPQMVERISSCLGIQNGQVNVKATTSEGLGFVGEGKGIQAYAVVLLIEKQ